MTRTDLWRVSALSRLERSPDQSRINVGSGYQTTAAGEPSRGARSGLKGAARAGRSHGGARQPLRQVAGEAGPYGPRRALRLRLVAGVPFARCAAQNACCAALRCALPPTPGARPLRRSRLQGQEYAVHLVPEDTVASVKHKLEAQTQVRPRERGALRAARWTSFAADLRPAAAQAQSRGACRTSAAGCKL